MICCLIAWLLLWAPGLARQDSAAYRILVTNDDGVAAPGLSAAAEALKPIGEVTIVAPADSQTGKGHSISITDPIYADRFTLPGGLAALALAATPASCVKVGLLIVMKDQPPHLVVSGINRGYNQGTVAYVSGTVGAAREAAMHGIPAIASSLAGAGHPDYQAAAAITARIARLVKAHGLPRGVFLNINVPAGAEATIKGVQMTTQSMLAGTERFVEHRNPRGRRYFWNAYQDPAGGDPGTDVWANENGYAAVTPLHVGELDRATFDAWKGLVK